MFYRHAAHTRSLPCVSVPHMCSPRTHPQCATRACARPRSLARLLTAVDLLSLRSSYLHVLRGLPSLAGSRFALQPICRTAPRRPQPPRCPRTRLSRTRAPSAPCRLSSIGAPQCYCYRAWATRGCPRPKRARVWAEICTRDGSRVS